MNDSKDYQIILTINNENRSIEYIKTILNKHFDVENLIVYETKEVEEERIDYNELFARKQTEIIRKYKATKQDKQSLNIKIV